MNKSSLRNVAVLTGLILLTGCATNTMTGRSQLSLVNEASVSKQSVTYYSSMMGEFGKKSKLVEGKDINTRINTITNRLIQQAVLYQPKSATWDWKVSVIDDDKTINAFCMPGGLMAIYTGLPTQLTATDDEIANVMGHEIGHALAGHGAEKMSMQMASNVAVLVISAILSKDARDMRANQNVLTAGALTFVNLPNGRVTEIEADKLGIELAARAGYNPEAAASLWEKMGVANKSKGKSDFFSTHPAPEKRQENLTKLAVLMQPLYSAAKNNPAPYDWLGGDKLNRPQPSESDAIAFYSEEWEMFKAGQTELAGTNQASHVMKQNGLAESYRAKKWRDLAMGVTSSNYKVDVGYFYLARAADGMGFKDAAKVYASKALELSQSDETACSKKLAVSCSGVNVLAELNN